MEKKKIQQANKSKMKSQIQMVPNQIKPMEPRLNPYEISPKRSPSFITMDSFIDEKDDDRDVLDHHSIHPHPLPLHQHQNDFAMNKSEIIIEEKPKRKKLKFRFCFRKFFAFFLSNVGLCFLVVAYSVVGAFMFRAIESPFEVQTAKQVNELRDRTVLKLWNITLHNNILFYEKWKLLVSNEIRFFQKGLLRSIKDGYEGQQSVGREQWSFSGAFLFSLTVISTIGYGNISPRTDKGKLMTILYAIVGIPLMLLYLTNIGDILAKSFRYVYGGLCSCQPNCRVLDKRFRQQKHLQQNDRQRRFLAQQTMSSVSGSINYSASNRTHFDFDEQSTQVSTPTSPKNFENSLGLYKSNSRIHVPLTLCLMILATYVCGGGALFSIWEKWNYLDGSYFCFVTLSTIGFGDLVPGASIVDNSGSQEKLAICSLYLLAGMAVLAMCFNLMQEEVIHKVRQLGKRLGIVSDDDNSTN
ncbi:Potassium channel subfamily K member 18 [Sarcoptes scabiei]|nr:Potassium channel subfamily K member 18 [Sarcoptes scabiei]